MHKHGVNRCTIIIGVILVLVAVASIQYKSIIKRFYPLKYKSYIIKYTAEYELDPYLISAIIKVESSYNPRAESKKSAKGLMQITPSTGKWVAEKLNITEFNDEMLYDPEQNIRIGCWYINNLIEEFGSPKDENNLVLILAAYNGGRGNVNKWLSDKEHSKTGKYLDDIPFKETRDYIKKVKYNYKIYKWLYPKF